MHEQPPPAPSGWSFAKVIGVIVGLIGMVGFGVCSLCGIVITAGDHMRGYWFPILGGAVLSFLFGLLMVTMFRKAREEREALQERDRSDRPDLRDP